MRKHIKTIICMVLVAVALPWLAENYWRFDPRLEYKGNDGVEHREVHMIVDGQEIALKLENNHLVGYTPVSKSNNSVTYVFYRDTTPPCCSGSGEGVPFFAVDFVFLFAAKKFLYFV